MGNLFHDVYHQGADASGALAIEVVLQQEMLAYKSDAVLATDSNSLLWWKTPWSKYLAQLVQCYFCILGTSVRAERVFSVAEIIVIKRKCSALDFENVDHLVFLANNL